HSTWKIHFGRRREFRARWFRVLPLARAPFCHLPGETAVRRRVSRVAPVAGRATPTRSEPEDPVVPLDARRVAALDAAGVHLDGGHVPVDEAGRQLALAVAPLGLEQELRAH